MHRLLAGDRETMSKPKTKPMICPSCKNGVRVPNYGVWRCPHCGYVLVGKTGSAR